MTFIAGDIPVGGEEISPTVGPVRRSTVQKTTWDQFEPKSTRDVGHSEHLYLSTGPTTSGPPADGKCKIYNERIITILYINS